VFSGCVHGDVKEGHSESVFVISFFFREENIKSCRLVKS
jgi:hypothetical protein